MGQEYEQDKQESAPESEQQQYSVNSFLVTLWPDGQADIQYDISIDPHRPETNVRLFGQTKNVSAGDKAGNPIGTILNEQLDNVTLDSLGVTNAIINYRTPDLTEKEGRTWIFSLNSTSRFSIILPADSVISDWGKQNPLLIKRIAADQNLITFDPGNIKLKYITEFLSTEKQADITIKSAETTIRDAKQRYPGIILTDVESLLQDAITSKNNNKNVDAETLATRANDLTLDVIKKYTSAQIAIEQTNAKLNKGSEYDGGNMTSSMALLSQAEKLFSNGDYVNARQQAENAIINMDVKGSIPASSSSSSFSSPDVSSQGTLTNMVIVVATITASVGIIIVTLFVIKKRKKPSLTATRLIGKKQDNNNSAIPKSEQGKVNESSISSRSNQSLDVRPADHYLPERKQYPSFSSSSPVPINPQQSNIDQTALLQKVLKIIEENQQLKVEDHQVLRFLAENQGAAFESEIRNKFQQLPKTTIWRLVKRLEREELIEIRKAAGQNLIKLRYENNVR
jgi:uncharacterized membrane protein